MMNLGPKHVLQKQIAYIMVESFLRITKKMERL